MKARALIGVVIAFAMTSEASIAAVEMLVGYRQSVQMTPGRILRFDADSGSFLGEFAEVDWPLHMVAGANGNLFVVNFVENAIQEHALDSGTLVNSFAIPPVGPDPPQSFFAAPYAIDFGSDGMLYASSFHHDRVYRYTPSGDPAPNSVFPLHLPIEEPVDLEFGPDGLLYATAADGIYRFDPITGIQADPGTFAPQGAFTFDVAGNLLVTEPNAVHRYAAGTGVDLGYFVSPGSGGLSGATDVLFGPNGNLFVVSHDLAGVLEYDGLTGDYVRSIIAPAGYSAPHDLFFHIVIPEPTSVTLGLFALASFSIRRRRGKQL